MRTETKSPPDAARGGPPPAGSGRAWTRMGTALRHVEEVSTGILFLVMFVTIVAGVAFRLLFDTPLVWTVSVSTLAFIGVVMIGSVPLNRDDGHISFDIVYQRLPKPAQLGARLFSDLLIIVPFAIAIGPTARYLSFLHNEQVPGVGLPFSIAFSPFLVFLIGTVLHRLVRMYGELRGLLTERSVRR